MAWQAPHHPYPWLRWRAACGGCTAWASPRCHPLSMAAGREKGRRVCGGCLAWASPTQPLSVGCMWSGLLRRVHGLGKPHATPVRGCVWRVRVEGAWPGGSSPMPPCPSPGWSAVSHHAWPGGAGRGDRRYWPASRSPAQHLVATHPTQHEENTISSWQGRYRVFFKNSESWRTVSYLNGVLWMWGGTPVTSSICPFLVFVSACVFNHFFNYFNL